MKQLPKQYDPKISEAHWQKQWETQGVYAFRDDKPREETFVIDTPPPTVSGILHMGHIFSYTQADFIARYKRMRGLDVFYPMGFDDNGLPTERLVEKTKNVRGSAMARGEFVALCKEVVVDAENEFRRLFKSVALSVDWKQEYQTINDDVQKLSQASFLDLLRKGEAYRDFRPTYWDWVDQTAIAQAEIENKEMPGVMNEIEFTLEGGEPLLIMTTRPELLGACVAVMYHPEDANAEKYKGKYAVTPLFGVKVPMIADEAVEREKGTGIVMCCTFGDDTDKEWWRKYGLPSRPVLGLDGRYTVTAISDQNIQESVVGFTGGKNGRDDTSNITRKNCVDIEKLHEIFSQLVTLKPKQANTKIIELLQASGKLLKQTPMTHTVKCAERSGTPIEIIPTHQWFVKLMDKKEALLAKGAEVVWHPEYMRIRLNQWIEGLKEDWCISRQRFFGVPFPIWYYAKQEPSGCYGRPDKIFYQERLPTDPLTDFPDDFQVIDGGKFEVNFDPEERKTRFFAVALKDFPEFSINKDEVVIFAPDKDVMDTWATSSISPQLNARAIAPSSCGPQSGSTGSDDRFNKLFPADLRPQAHEIIRTWAFYTIAKAHLHTNTVPWKNIMISGWCLAADKTKMSKSKGNVVTPVDLIEEKGADAVRYWASTSRLATDTAFSEDLLKIGKKLVGKIWNASNFITQLPAAAQPANAATEMLDKWILSRLHVAVSKATAAFEQFEYCDARVAIEDFFWNDFCDNYLELVKARAYNEGAGQASALYTLERCLDTLLRLFAPFVPHVTEEIYSHLFAEKGSVHDRGKWPLAANYAYDEQAERAGTAALEVLNVVRKAKSEAGVSIKTPVTLIEIAENTGKIIDIESVKGDLLGAANAAGLTTNINDTLKYTSQQGWFNVNVVIGEAEKMVKTS